MNTVTRIVALIGIALLAGCAGQTQPDAGANPYPPVPAAVAETIPKPPVTSQALMWQPGHWDWTGGGYVWARGQYVPAAGHGNMWTPGWWSPGAAGWTWQPAHWSS